MKQTAAIVEKHPLESTWLSVDWNDVIAALGNPTISDSSWVDATSLGLSFSNNVVIDGVAKARVSGGDDGTIGYVENRVTFSDSSLLVFTITLNIADKVPD